MSKDHGHYTNELEHDAEFRVKKVSSFVSDGNGNLVREMTEDLLTYVAVNSSDNLISYLGRAAPGTATSAASWQIRKIDENSGTIITYADGDADFDNVWDNRESLSYS